MAHEVTHAGKSRPRTAGICLPSFWKMNGRPSHLAPGRAPLRRASGPPLPPFPWRRGSLRAWDSREGGEAWNPVVGVGGGSEGSDGVKDGVGSGESGPLAPAAAPIPLGRRAHPRSCCMRRGATRSGPARLGGGPGAVAPPGAASGGRASVSKMSGGGPHVTPSPTCK